MIISHKKLKEDIRKEIINIISEEKTSNIEDLVYAIMDYQNNGDEKKAREYFSILFPRLAALGFDREKLMRMKVQIQSLSNEKEAEKFINKWKLHSDYINKHSVYVYYVILGVPFSTDKNQEEKMKQLKYYLSINDIKLLKISKPKSSHMIAAAGSAGNVVDLKFIIKIKTTKSSSQLESIFQPKYSIDKIKRIEKELDEH